MTGSWGLQTGHYPGHTHHYLLPFQYFKVPRDIFILQYLSLFFSCVLNWQNTYQNFTRADVGGILCLITIDAPLPMKNRPTFQFKFDTTKPSGLFEI